MTTRRPRARLPRDFCYTLSAQTISAVLEGTPQFEALRVDFLSSRFLPRTRRVSQPPRPLLHALYHDRQGSRFLPLSSLTGPRWELWIYAVHREDLALVRELMNAQGLPRLRAWLLEHARPYETQTSLRLEILLDENLGALAFQEHPRP